MVNRLSNFLWEGKWHTFTFSDIWNSLISPNNFKTTFKVLLLPAVFIEFVMALSKQNFFLITNMYLHIHSSLHLFKLQKLLKQQFFKKKVNYSLNGPSSILADGCL